MTLILIIIGFLSKYALSVAVAHHPELAADPDYNVFYGVIAGVVDGMLWGRTILQLFQAYGRNGQKATWSRFSQSILKRRL